MFSESALAGLLFPSMQSFRVILLLEPFPINEQIQKTQT